MGSMSIGHWLIVLAIVLLLFGANKIPRLMGDLAKGIKAFKSGMKEEAEKVEEQPKPVDVTPTAATAAAASKSAEAEKKV
jgi:sec-independent protein translocase protein TatA